MKDLNTNQVRRKLPQCLKGCARSAVVCTFALLRWAMVADAQVNSNSATVSLTATLPESLGFGESDERKLHTHFQRHVGRLIANFDHNGLGFAGHTE